MKLYNYLNENRSQEITEDQFDNLLEKNCSDIIKIYKQTGEYIYRGLSGGRSPYIHIDPTKSIRKSRNTSNFYTIMFDEILPSWKKYPLRSKSIICATSVKVAMSYGKLYKVYPYNGSKIGKAPRTDIWLSFMNTFGDSLDVFNSSLLEIARFFGIDIQENKQSIISFAKELDELKNKHKDLYKDEKIHNEFGVYHLLPNYLKSNKSFIEYVDGFLNAEKNGFSHYTTSNLKLNPNKEIWIEGPCLMVDDNIYIGV